MAFNLNALNAYRQTAGIQNGGSNYSTSAVNNNVQNQLVNWFTTFVTNKLKKAVDEMTTA